MCPDCGTREADWIDSDGRHLDNPTWEVMPVRCYGCRAIAAAAADVPQEEKGVRIVLRPAGQQLV